MFKSLYFVFIIFYNVKEYIPLRFSPHSRFALQSAHTRPLIYNKFVLLLTSSFGCRKKRFKAEIQVRYHDQDTAVRRSEQLINVTNVDEQDYNVDVGDLC